MSLAFLAKKSWHTSNLKNVEKVWIAEQKSAQEHKKLAELKKQIDEERQIQELRQLQVQTGERSSASVQERVDWLYDGPMAHSTNTQEEYLLGKEYQAKEATSELKQLGTQPGALYMQGTVVDDSFSRLNEDPMLLIRKRQQAAQKNILNNPVKMKSIKSRVEQELNERKARKKAKKEAKKEVKKEKKRLKRDEKVSKRSAASKERMNANESEPFRRKSVSDEGPARRDLRRNQRSLSPMPRSRRDSRSSPSRERKYDRKRDKSCSSASSRSRSLRRRRSSPRENLKSRSDSQETNRARRKRRRRSRSRSLEGRYEEVDVSVRRRKSRSRSMDRRQRSPRKPSGNAGEGEEIHFKSLKKASTSGKEYGLLRSSHAQLDSSRDTSTLGPNTEFLKKAREAKKEEDRLVAEKLSSQRSRSLTEEEKQRKLHEMAEDAKYREMHIERRGLLKGNPKDETSSSLKDPSFLRKLQTDVYMGSGENMEDRLRRNRHYIQKNADASNFLKK